ncbi:MAG: RNA polymerase subunit sigma-24 [Crocinitomicaceae bacterium]|nr:RNA polymerase subunit sigma-24 [Crocinitomicaceae bacterium]|tara:strand:+ start:439 stop:981 length:543 start_codon:yes stop_codon:yes gene_type:complete
MSPKSENREKLESFFKEEYTTLKNYVGSRLKSSASKDTEDIVQDVAFNLFAGADGYGPISNVAGFVYRSVKNKIIDTLRKGNREINVADDNEAKWFEFAELMSGNSEQLFSDELVKSLKEAMDHLKPLDYEIIMAVDFEGYTFREISEETGTPEGTLMSRRHRALSKLYKALKEKRKIRN